MNDRLREYVNGIFNGVPMNKETIEFREELLQNLNEKYSDLIREGKSEQAAYNIAIAGIGDVQSLLSDIVKRSSFPPAPAEQYTPADSAEAEELRKKFEENKKKEKIMTAIGVVLCILSPISVILASQFGNVTIGIVIMFIMIAAAVAMFICMPDAKEEYEYSMDTSIADEFRQWTNQKKGIRSLRQTIRSCVWAVSLAIYFLISFTSRAWWITWLVFPLAAALSELAVTILDLKNMR